MTNNTYKLVTASWCGPCKILKAQLEEANIEVEQVNADTSVDYCQKMGIRSIPTLVVNDTELISKDIFKYLEKNS